MREPTIPAATVRGSLPAPPPASDEPPPDGVIVVPTYKLYSAGQMALATFLGTPFAGCLLLGRNYSRLRQRRAAWVTYGLGALITALFLYAAIVVPDFPRILSLGGVIGIGVLGNALQGEEVRRHERDGGRRASWWVAVGLSLLTTLCWVLLGIATFVAYELANEEPRIERNGGEVIYAKGATAAEATAVADQLVELAYFDGDAASVRLERDQTSGRDDRLVALFVVKESALRDDKVKTFFESMTIKLSERALGGKPIDIWLTDNVWERRTSISWEARPRELLFGKDNVTVRRGADDAHGKRLGELLQRMHYFEGTGSSVIFERHGRFLTTFVVDPAAMTDDVVAQFHWFAWRISKHVVEGSPVDVVLVDPAGKSLHRLSWDHRPQDPLVTTSGNEITRGEKCTEDDARNTAEVFATVLTAHPGVNVWIECLDRVGVTLQDKQPFEAAGVPVDALSKRFEDRPVDLFIVATEGDTTLEQRWEDRARKTKRKK